jgi:hypothetical protein
MCGGMWVKVVFCEGGSIVSMCFAYAFTMCSVRRCHSLRLAAMRLRAWKCRVFVRERSIRDRSECNMVGSDVGRRPWYGVCSVWCRFVKYERVILNAGVVVGLRRMCPNRDHRDRAMSSSMF